MRGSPRLGAVALAIAAASCADTSNNAAMLPAGRADGGGLPGPDARADAAIDASASDGADAANVKEPGYLWYAGGALSAFTRGQTLASHDDGPGWLLQTSPAQNFHDLVFDSAGDLWTLPVSGDRILRIPARQLGSVGGRLAPDLVLQSAALAGADALTFDETGNLWVVNFSGAGSAIANIVRFDDPRSLSPDDARSASPSLTIVPGNATAAQARFGQASSLTFDAVGNLWVVAIANVLRFDVPGSWRGEVVAAPAAVLSTGDALVAAAFDARGSLWVTAAGGGGYSALRIDAPAALVGAVTPVAAARLQLPAAGASFAGGMTLAPDGGLWIITSNRILEIPQAAALTGDVSPSAAVVLGNLGYPDLTTKLIIR